MQFAIFTPVYDENSGGALVLHKLCHLLNEQGHDAKLVVYYKNLIVEIDDSYPCPYPVASAALNNVMDRIAIYPEIVEGNPLGCKQVVRWFLHRPGFHTGKIEYGSNELYFFYKPEFNDENINPDKENLLKIFDIKENIYRNEGHGERKGSCFLVRKGKARSLTYHPPDAVQIDHMKHQEIARIFNEREFFISYDPDTMFLRYAAMCGCLPVIAPDPNISQEDWYRVNRRRYGIAYGFNEITWASETLPLAMQELQKELKEMRSQVSLLIEKCKAFR